jgi:hypothetical protein
MGKGRDKQDLSKALDDLIRKKKVEHEVLLKLAEVLNDPEKEGSRVDGRKKNDEHTKKHHKNH